MFLRLRVTFSLHPDDGSSRLSEADQRLSQTHSTLSQSNPLHDYWPICSLNWPLSLAEIDRLTGAFRVVRPAASRAQRAANTSSQDMHNPQASTMWNRPSRSSPAAGQAMQSAPIVENIDRGSAVDVHGAVPDFRDAAGSFHAGPRQRRPVRRRPPIGRKTRRLPNPGSRSGRDGGGLSRDSA